MAVPDFQSFMLPLLRFAADGQEHSLAQAREHLASDLELSVSDLEEVIPSGRQTRFYNRLTWAKLYLAHAGLLLALRRGHFQITDHGRGVLQAPPSRIDIKYLEQFTEFAEFRKAKVAPDGKTPTPGGDGGESPEEALEVAHAQMTASLATEVLERVKAGAPAFFERLVVELLLKMGYGGSRTDAGQAVGKSGDEGIDGVISEDRLGLDVVYLQAKKWDGTVGRPEIQKFVGALHGRQAKKGVFITTGSYSAEALAYVEHIDPKVVLIDGRRLAELMIDFEVGVATARTYHVKRVDSDYFDEG
ncbi:MAG: restriction endonuclease [Candidatus Sumerlaeota bacterium]|nr:restriction endonuclease [Candidatus Sumerlaeota bacterium]